MFYLFEEICFFNVISCEDGYFLCNHYYHVYKAHGWQADNKIRSLKEVKYMQSVTDLMVENTSEGLTFTACSSS